VSATLHAAVGWQPPPPLLAAVLEVVVVMPLEVVVVMPLELDALPLPTLLTEPLTVPPMPDELPLPVELAMLEPWLPPVPVPLMTTVVHPPVTRSPVAIAPHLCRTIAHLQARRVSPYARQS
jgi:hypothetical protein